MFARTIKQLGFSSAILATMVTAGCTSLSGGKEPQVQTFEPGKSFAYNVSILSDINPPKTSQLHIKDIEVTKGETQNLEHASTDLLGVGIAGGMMAFPSSFGSSGMNGFMAVDLLLGSVSGPPTLLMHQDTTVAWFPVDQASSAKDAMDKFHEMRVEGVMRSITERGMVPSRDDALDIQFLPWEPAFHNTVITVRNFGDMCKEGGKNSRACVFAITTRMPEVKTVTAPKEITGQPYQAYLFKPKDKLKRAMLVMALNLKRENKEYYVIARDFNELRWLTKYQPDWSVHYVSAPKYLTSEQIKAHPELINPFPFMVHKGEIKLFAVERAGNE